MVSSSFCDFQFTVTESTKEVDCSLRRKYRAFRVVSIAQRVTPGDVRAGAGSAGRGIEKAASMPQVWLMDNVTIHIRFSMLFEISDRRSTADFVSETSENELTYGFAKIEFCG